VHGQREPFPVVDMPENAAYVVQRERVFGLDAVSVEDILRKFLLCHIDLSLITIQSMPYERYKVKACATQSREYAIISGDQPERPAYAILSEDRFSFRARH
jgi:hypothetical protein